MPEEIEPSQVVTTTTIVESLPGGVKKLRRRRKRKTLARSRVVSKSLETPDTEKHHPVWFSTLANMALLIAIFAIIFAAHHAIQNNRQPPIILQKEVVAQQPTAVTPEPVVEPIKTELVKNEEQEIEAVAQESEVIEPVKPKVSLERRPVINRNPWNDGGTLDLDSATARQEYKNKGYLSSTD